MKLILRPIALGIIVILLSTASVLAQAPAQQQQPEFVKQGQQLMREGKPEEALALYRQTLQTSPNSVPANLAAGSVLDIMGKGEEAREYFTKAIDVADTPEHKAGARRAMAMSYAFEGNCDKTIEYEQQVFDFYGSVKNFFQQGEIADEAARVCLDSVRFGYLVQVVRDRSRHGTEGTGNQTRPSKPVELSVGARAGPHRGSARRPSRSAKACCCGKGHPRQRHHPRASPVLPVPEGLRRVLCGRLQSGARRTESGKPERPVHPVHDWPELREIGREAKSRGVLPQSFNGCFAQSCRRIRGSIRQEEAVLAACGLHERRPNQVPRRWLDVSDTRTPAATETLIESQPPLIGMRTRNRRDLQGGALGRLPENARRFDSTPHT